MRRAFVLAMVGSIFSGIIPYQVEVSAKPIPNTVTAQANKTTKVPITMPTSGTVVFKDGTFRTGSIVYDAKQKKYIIGKKSFPTTDISKIVLGNSSNIIATRDGITVIRGKDNSVVEPEIWMKIPLDSLQMINSETGLAEVDLIKSFDYDRIRDIRSVAQSSRYVVSEIAIDPTTGYMNIKVVPVDSIKSGTSQ